MLNKQLNIRYQNNVKNEYPFGLTHQPINLWKNPMLLSPQWPGMLTGHYGLTFVTSVSID